MEILVIQKANTETAKTMKRRARKSPAEKDGMMRVVVVVASVTAWVHLSSRLLICHRTRTLTNTCRILPIKRPSPNKRPLSFKDCQLQRIKRIL